MDTVSDLEGLPAHHALLERAVDHFQDDDRVVGMVLGGSLAHGTADFYSDIDLYVVTRDESFEAVFGERDDAAEALGSPLFRFVADHLPGGSQDYYVAYQGPLRFDFMYYRESEMVPDLKWVGCPVLKDETGSVADILVRSEDLAPPAPTREMLVALDQKFWTWCWYTFAKIARGELWEALNGMHTIRSEALLPMLDWKARCRHEGYRRLETKLDPETAARLEATVAPLEAEALYGALLAAITLYRDLREVTFEHYGMTLDPEPEGVIISEIRQHWSARKS